MGRSILKGALSGLLAWVVYGIVEFVLAYGSQMAFQSNTYLQPNVEIEGWQWSLLGLLLVLYALAGAFLGGISGALVALWTQDGNRHEFLAALTLVLAFVANLVSSFPPRHSEYFALVLACVLAALFIAAVFSDTWCRRVGFMASPWVVCLLLLSSPWLIRELLLDRSATVKTALSSLLIAAILFVALLAQRLRLERSPSMRKRSAVIGTTSLGLVLVIRLMTGESHAAQTGPATATLNKPNVVLIVLDTVRADHLSAYGYQRDTSPRLKEFARQATLYKRAIAVGDMSLNTHASMFTGLYPGWHGAYIQPPSYPVGRPLESRHATLAETLGKNGYRTEAVVANYAYLQPSMGVMRGFAANNWRRPMRLSSNERPFYLREGARRLLHHFVDTDTFLAQTRRAADINREAFKLLESPSRSPLFLFLNYMDAHRPYTPPAAFSSLFPGRSAQLHADDWGGVDNRVNRGGQITRVEQQHFVSQYDGGIAYMDAEIGKLFDKLRALGQYENSLIVITADHGEAFGEHGQMEHAVGSVYQNHIFIPLLIKYPRQHEADSSNALASQVDLMPTILEAAGIQFPSELQGRPLRHTAVEDSAVVYSESRAFGSLQIYPRLRGVRRAIYSGPVKFIAWSNGPPEFYDLEYDPAELHNLAGAGDSRETALAGLLANWAAAIPSHTEKTRKLDNSTIENLKGLGYLK